MKRLATLLLFTGITFFTTFAQRQLVLIEEFTNTGCGPCATWSPVLDSAIHYRLGDVIAIKYHANYPNKQDRYWLYDTETQGKKMELYGVSGVPSTFVDGMELPSRTYQMVNTMIDYYMAQPRPLTVGLSTQLSDHHLTCHTQVQATADVATGDLRLFVVAVEEHYESSTPFPNGERELNYTMRHMMPAGGDGQPLSIPMATGQTVTWDCEWAIDNDIDEQQLGVVAFVQDMSTRQVLATTYIGPEAEGEDRLIVVNVDQTPDLICSPDYYGRVIFRNDGANALTSATLNIEVNGTLKQYPWTGHLDYLERDTLLFADFTEFQLAASGTNTVNVWFSEVNGTQAASNSRTLSFSNSIQARHAVRMRLYTDKKPEETTWRVLNSAGDVVLQGGPYTQARKLHTEDFLLTRDDCYTLQLLDAGGDGIKGAYGNGYYQLFQIGEDGTATRLTQGDYTGAEHRVNFHLTEAPAPQRERLVLFEEFTNTSCDPCAEFSPALDATIYRSMGRMVAITYHWNFPSARDPFYLANTTDVLARAGYYGITGVPSLFVDGERCHAWGYEDMLPAYITNAQQVAETVALETTAQLVGDNLQVSTTVTPVENIEASNVRLFVAAVEERVEWAEAAANGERAWNYVMRKMLTTGEGHPLPATMTAGTPQSYQFSAQLDNFTDLTELGIVTFAQDMTTGQVLGAAYTPRPTGSTRAAKILQVMNTPDRICTPDFTADLAVRNTGTERLTSANINVSINGQVQVTPWTGSLDYLQIDTLRTPLFSDFALSSSKVNEVEIWLSDLNGQTERTVSKHLSVTNAVAAQHAVQLTIMTDNRPQEITWTLLNSAGDVVEEGGPYTEARTKVSHVFNLGTDDCYTLEFEDAGGDGITGDNGRGYYMLHEVNAEGKTRLLTQADYTTALHDVYFSLTGAAPLAIGQLTVQADEQGQVFDLQGRLVGNAAPGEPLRLPVGVYVLRYNHQGTDAARKVVVE